MAVFSYDPPYILDWITENYYSMMVLSTVETLRMEKGNLWVLIKHGCFS
jgi:hypothetical protein